MPLGGPRPWWLHESVGGKRLRPALRVPLLDVGLCPPQAWGGCTVQLRGGLFRPIAAMQDAPHASRCVVLRREARPLLRQAARRLRVAASAKCAAALAWGGRLGSQSRQWPIGAGLGAKQHGAMTLGVGSVSESPPIHSSTHPSIQSYSLALHGRVLLSQSFRSCSSASSLTRPHPGVTY